MVNDRMMTYLTTGDEVDDDTSPDAKGEVFDSVTAQLAEIAKNAGLDLSRNDPEPPAQDQRRPDAIIALLEQAGGEDGLAAAEIAEALNENGDTAANPTVLAPTLSRMHTQGKIRRVSHGRYTAFNPTA